MAALPCADIEEKYIQKFSKEVPVQLQKVVIEPLQHDERGAAFSTGEGNNFLLICNDADFFPLHTAFFIKCTTLLKVSLLHFMCSYIYMYTACIAVNDVMEHQLKTWTGQKVQIFGPDYYHLVFICIFIQ